jgi:hypothetical protein
MVCSLSIRRGIFMFGWLHSSLTPSVCLVPPFFSISVQFNSHFQHNTTQHTLLWAKVNMKQWERWMNEWMRSECCARFKLFSNTHKEKVCKLSVVCVVLFCFFGVFSSPINFWSPLSLSVGFLFFQHFSLFTRNTAHSSITTKSK